MDKEGCALRFENPPWGLILAGVLLVCLCLCHLAFKHASSCDVDDAYITYRYAQNFAEGHGLVFNPSTPASERVEGYTTLLYVLMMSAAYLIVGAGGMYAASTLLNLVLSAIAMLVLYGHLRRTVSDRAATVGAILFALCPGVWLWTVSGMETALVLLLQMLVWTMTARLAEGDGRAGVTGLVSVAALLVLARADGFVFPVIAACYLYGYGKRRDAVALGAATVGVFLAYVAWRLHYYGYPLPNTYYVKVCGPLDERVRRAVHDLARMTFFNGLSAAAVALAYRVIRAWRVARSVAWNPAKALGTEAFLGLGWLAYWIYIGGDWFLDRFLLILYPLSLSVLLKAVAPLGGRLALALVAALVAATQLALLATDRRFQGYSFQQKPPHWRVLGELLRDRHAGKTLAVDAAGMIPYYSGLHTIDMLGLNDKHIGHLTAARFDKPGHNKYDADYVLSKRPDLIVAWIAASSSGHVDLDWGLSHAKYTAAGYSLRYLLAFGGPTDRDIVDVQGKSGEEVQDLIGKRYIYAVLERQ